MSGLEFTEGQVERYSRNILLSEIGGGGQKKLLGSNVFMVGAGGLGSPALLYLAAAGIGKIGVADGDDVELSNLQRQIIHRTPDVGKSKTVSAEAAIHKLNPDCEVEIYSNRLDMKNIREVIHGYNLVLDGSDNFPTRYMVADACWLEGIPLVSAASVRFQGQLMTLVPGDGNPCYRCIFPEPPPPGSVPSCQEAGVLGAVVGVMGTLQVVEAVKVLLGIGDILSHKLLIYDALNSRFMTVKRSLDPECPLCGLSRSITEPTELEAYCTTG